VAVVGGGNVAIDAARTALRLGSEEVSILYRRTQAEMPAYEEEIQEALEEGVKLQLLTMPTEIGNQMAGPARSNASRWSWASPMNPDAGGRCPLRAASSPSSWTGLSRPSASRLTWIFWSPRPIWNRARPKRLIADPLTLQTNLPWVFAGGDVVTGPASVIEAVQHGKEAATSIDRFLNDQDLSEGRTAERSCGQTAVPSPFQSR
jgi:heterodisulfide reductase subunit A